MRKARFVTAPQMVPVEPASCTSEQIRTIHMLLSVLLEYPGPKFLEALDAVGNPGIELPESIQNDLEQFTDWATRMGERGTHAHYVDIFDQQRRCALYLSYYVAGDTRLRGSAILGFRQFAEALGYRLERDELDDFLPVLLELSAVTGDHLVVELLASHREGIEVMRSALHQADSPYKYLLDALARTLPDVDDETYDRFQRLITQGPPTEMVGVHLPTLFPSRSSQ